MQYNNNRSLFDSKESKIKTTGNNQQNGTQFARIWERARVHEHNQNKQLLSPALCVAREMFQTDKILFSSHSEQHSAIVFVQINNARAMSNLNHTDLPVCILA